MGSGGPMIRRRPLRVPTAAEAERLLRPEDREWLAERERARLAERVRKIAEPVEVTPELLADDARRQREERKAGRR